LEWKAVSHVGDIICQCGSVYTRTQSSEKCPEIMSDVGKVNIHAPAMAYTCTGWVRKSKLLILSEYVNKTEEIGGT